MIPRLSLALPRLSRCMSSARKPGVAAPAAIAAFIAQAGPHLAIVDARSPDIAEPSSTLGALAPTAARPRAVNAPIDRATGALPLAAIPAAWIEAAGGRERLFVITHCGGGGRGQKAKDFLLQNGFVHVCNGGGPEDAECWAEFGTR
jgi:rhodanese-related sulfurtransferase